MNESLTGAGEGSADRGAAAPTVCTMLQGCLQSVLASLRGAASNLEEAIDVAAHAAGVVQVTGTLGPTEMMLCKADGSDKHPRWFKVDADKCTIEWGKAADGNALVLPTKGPFQIIAVQEQPDGMLEISTNAAAEKEATGVKSVKLSKKGMSMALRAGSGETVRIKPSPGDYGKWLDCVSAVVKKNRGEDWKDKTSAGFATHEGVRGPVNLMLCKKDCKDKHVRGFRLNCDECTIEWAEIWVGDGAGAVRKGGKGPFRLIGLKEVKPVNVKATVENGKEQVRCLELSCAGAPAATPVYIKPEPQDYESWCACLRSVAMKGASLEKGR